MKFQRENYAFNEKNVFETAGNLTSYAKYLKRVFETKNYDFNESSIKLSFDEELLKNVLKIKKEKASADLKYVIVVGIGGSNLGAKAIYDALYGHFDVLEPERFPKMIFADTNDPEFLKKIKIFLKNKIQKPEEIMINIISKSGNTLETKLNHEFIAEILEEKFGGEAKNRTVAITDFQSKLWMEAKEKDISILEIPEKVGGRYSVFSVVGLFPLSVCGIDVESFRNGARDAAEKCFNEKISENPAAVSAAIIFLNHQSGKTINDNFFFHPELESLGKWQRQLTAESLGKNGLGITPTVSIGSTDLHSMAQLYLSGPKDKFTIFVWSECKNGSDGKFSKTMKSILEAVKVAYVKKELPFTEIILDDLSPRSLGEFTQFKMMETMFLAKLLGVDAFNQPNVEDYKKEIKNYV